ncbi:MAG: NAD(P)/FAD-dependent oxidoreductase [Leptolyngbyaceae cyanobacterium]
MNKIIGIIGGGPAGMSCALWLKNLGFCPIIFEQKDHLGGLQTLSPFPNRWYLGVMGQTGQQLAQQFRQCIDFENIRQVFNAPIEKIVGVNDDQRFHLFTPNHDVVVDGVVIATGQRFRGPEAIASIPGSDLLTGSPQVDFTPGYVPVTHGQVVAVVGGGDNGLGFAQVLAPTAKHVHLFIRSELRGFGMNRAAIANFVKSGHITLHQPASIQRFEPTDQGIAIYFNSPRSQTANESSDPTSSNPTSSNPTSSDQKVIVDYTAFRLGFTPNVEAIAARLTESGLSLKCALSGHIATDEFMRTSIPKIYAIGDVTKPRDPCVSTAAAYGAIAARSIDEDFADSWDD